MESKKLCKQVRDHKSMETSYNQRSKVWKQIKDGAQYLLYVG